MTPAPGGGPPAGGPTIPPAEWLVCQPTARALDRLQPVLAELAAAEDLQLQVIARELL